MPVLNSSKPQDWFIFCTMRNPALEMTVVFSIPLVFLYSPTKRPEDKTVNNKFSPTKMEPHKSQ